MRRVYIFKYLLFVVVAALTTRHANADPCGLVPPLYLADDAPIKRIGVQKTYVFYRRGLETLVLRPGFSGKVDEFGMLIPFPTPPAIRKMPDNVFEQIAAAIDPPEVVVDLRPQMMSGMKGGSFGGGGFGGGMGGGFGGMGFVPKNEVRVIREEAVGMYEVAVLAAGSAESLKRWMDDHEYVYPSGMDVVCPEYIQDGWCFVAVKTKVKQKDAAEPRPGQRAIDNDLPEGATFDGHVQAMGFRFRSRRLVVPMRLSVHNPGELRNIVYLLADGPAKIRNIPEKFVVRQVSGYKLFDQLTEPLPLRILGGTINDVPRARLKGLPAERDPEPHNGVAADLFAADMLAARTGRLENRSEAVEKHLLQINEALELRGQEIDDEVRHMLRRERARIVRSILRSLDKMTLTVIDGDFPREVLARENLTFVKYHMPRERSNRTYYDANEMGPPPPKFGVVVPGELRSEPSETMLAAVESPSTNGLALPLDGRAGRSLPNSSSPADNSAGTDPHPNSLPGGEATTAKTHWSQMPWLTLTLSLVAVGLLIYRRMPRRVSTLVLGLAVIVGFASVVSLGRSDEPTPTLRSLIVQLGDADVAKNASDQIIAFGPEAVPALITQTRKPELITRGWAIVCLGRIGGEEATAHLKRIYTNRNTAGLVRTWAAAAMVKAARSREELGELSQLAKDFPAVSRPIVLEFQRRLQKEAGFESVEAVLVAASRYPALEKQIAEQLLASGHEPLVRTMVEADDQDVRRKAAAYLATLGRAPDAQDIAADVANALRFDAEAKTVPWHGGPLFLPAIQWPSEEAQLLVGNLIRWQLWSERRKRTAELRQIHNNLRSVALARAAGYSTTRSLRARDWLSNWKVVVGREEIKRILVEQGALKAYSDVIDPAPKESASDEDPFG